MKQKFFTTTFFIALLSGLICTLSVAILSVLFYYSSVRAVLQDVDDRLIVAASGANLILGNSFHDRIENGKSISEDEHFKNVTNLTEFADKCGVDYVYTMIKSSEEIVFSSTSATKADLANKKYDPFYKVYNSASENVKKSFTEKSMIFEEFQDEYGNFRSVMIPFKSPGGKNYIAGADISIEAVNEKMGNVKKNIIIAVLMIIANFIVIFLAVRIVLKQKTASLPPAAGNDGKS